eukprot:1139617-Pelagomonas_calceolata.AAC.13
MTGHCADRSLIKVYAYTMLKLSITHVHMDDDDAIVSNELTFQLHRVCQGSRQAHSARRTKLGFRNELRYRPLMQTWLYSHQEP